ncbi:MAG: SIMPL domain-containing protein [Phenylobacterium sp.]|uniref:SIMPL domain-containing protein n=1 Tax=Phenylobacterium sp. TaxID=1871053 RepID=UPI001B414DC7|nr:SIMPL domain-containing protein [Phenylobacterium sp.]MBP7817418.1 SIMPL domain-containing protein [Phenylobacterium sp.]MBP9231143.1 SIMPL domain-containing protein [Phenylobacterium sp.]MBP9753881.1 SIMPL domain-containing protein [Phenylobacterium sp.]
MKTLVRAGALSLLLATTVAAPAALAQTAPPAADSMFRSPTLNLSAYGETRVAPDMATINLGVNTEAPTAAAAMAANATQMNRIFAALRRAGVADKDIQTSGLNLNAQYDYVENNPPRLRGYQATNQVTVTVHDLARLGSAVDATVSAGANQVNGISFGLNDPTAAENAAREEAVKALSAKANLYARATGYRVGRLVTLSEGGGYTPPSPMPMMAMARMEKDSSTPVAGGELRVRVDVTALYELTR